MAGGIEHDLQSSRVAVGRLPGCRCSPSQDGTVDAGLDVVDCDFEVHHHRRFVGSSWPDRTPVLVTRAERKGDVAVRIAEPYPTRTTSHGIDIAAIINGLTEKAGVETGHRVRVGALH